MSREEIYEQLNEVFRDVFDDDTIEVNDQTTSRDIEDWDSLEHINLIAAIETQFGMKFTMGQVVTMKNVGEMVDIISSQEKRSSGKPRDADRWRVPVWETPS
jgi:acyl carrier protein